MTGCAAYGCGNTTNKMSREEVKGYHVVPPTGKLHDKWIAAIRREPPYPQEFKICGMHFKAEDFERDYRHLAGQKRKFTLNENAVPSIFVFSSEKIKRRISESRAHKRDEKDTVAALLLEIPVVSTPEIIDYDEATSSTAETQDNTFLASEKNLVSRAEPESLTTEEEEEETMTETSDTTENESQPDSSFNLPRDEYSEESGDDADPIEDLNMVCMVEFKQLKELLCHCMECGAPTTINKQSKYGVHISIWLSCSNGHDRCWSSFENTPHFNANVQVAAGILLSGSTFSHFQEAMRIMNVGTLAERTFYRIQSNTLFPAVNAVYNKKSAEILNRVKESGEVLDLVGDGRCDSPGYNAKYGTYTLMNDKNDEIIDFFIAHVGNTTNSQNLEKYGLAYLLEYLTNNNISIHILTTDQHLQIRKFLKDNYPAILHQFDIWHRAKNLRKKLTKVANKKENILLQPWIRSIIQHFWWSCATCNGNPSLLKEKWASILKHICGVHNWHDGVEYTKCAHGILTNREQLSYKWLELESPAHKALTSVVLDKRLLSDIPNLAEFKHSGNLEVFHSVLLKYCPKRLCFSYEGMYARTQLAVLDHNSGIGRNQASKEDGTLRYKTQYSKVTEQWVVKEIRESKDKSYLTEIIEEIKQPSEGDIRENKKLEQIPQNIAPSKNPGKEELIKSKITRFKNYSI